MSAIDTIRHERVGIFCGIPVYHPLQEAVVDGVSCSPKNLLIGGGSGEHPIVLLQRPDLAVGHFIALWIEKAAGRFESEAAFDKDLKKRGASLKTWKKFVDTAAGTPLQRLFQFHFTVADYHRFYETCATQARFPTEDNQFFETWLAENLGEFIFFSMPELFPDLEKNLPGARQAVNFCLYMNVLATPKGYPPC